MINYKQLLQNAKQAQLHSYSPYSKFPVGACLITKNNKIYLGANIENSSYGACICAERVAIDKAVFDGETQFLCLAIYTQKDNYTFPCGICRQVIAEFSPDTEIVVGDEDNFKVYNINQLLPHNFSKEDLK